MKFIPTEIKGAYILECDAFSDSRGSFARTFCAREFREHGLNPEIAQCNLCSNREEGTLRGLHYQVAPALESKLIRCLQGAIHDVIVDLRPDSPSYLKHVAVELSAGNQRALYAPPMCAHGYQTLTRNAQVFYQAGGFYSPAHERGVRFDDPALEIQWPLPVGALSEKDANWPLLARPVETLLNPNEARNLA